jgi:hypothetical protein
MGFSRMVAGFFFVFFDFNFGNINFLPDLIGYIMILAAVSGPISRMSNKHFSVLKKIAILLLALSALDMFITYSSVLNGMIIDPSAIHNRLFLLLFTIMKISMLVYLFYNLSKGIEQEAQKTDAKGLINKARKTYKLVFIYQMFFGIVTCSTILFVKNSFTFSAGPIGFVIIIALLIVTISIFINIRSMLKQAEYTLRDTKE